MKLTKAQNPPNRFQTQHLVWDEEIPETKTEVYEERAKSIITKNNSPDVGFDHSINPYRGCSHACIYCFARPYHEYLGWGAGSDFETKLVAKVNAPELLYKELMKPSWKGDTLAFSFTSDPYIPLEGKYELTRGCLEVALKFRNPVSVITKSPLILRDLDLLTEFNREAEVGVAFSIPVLDNEISRVIEPGTPSPEARLKALSKLAENGIRTGVAIAPIIPGLNDYNIPEIIKRIADAGAEFAFINMLRLPGNVAPYFVEKIEAGLPLKSKKILNRVKEMRDGRLNNPNFGERMKGKGNHWEMIKNMFRVACEKYGLNKKDDRHRKRDTFCRPGSQIELF
jgi:DNA repair photolyase